MKKLLLLLFLISAVSLYAPPSGTVKLAFDYPDSEVTPDLVFYLYGSSSLNIPMTNWVALASTEGTNRAFTATIMPGRYYFVAIVSNFWGVSDFSNVVSVPPLPRNDTKLTIQRGN